MAKSEQIKSLRNLEHTISSLGMIDLSFEYFFEKFDVQKKSIDDKINELNEQMIKVNEEIENNNIRIVKLKNEADKLEDASCRSKKILSI